MMDKNTVLVAGAVLFREQQGKIQWFLIKQQEGIEFPKVVARKGESSVRAILRLMGEKGGMTTRVLDEAGRVKGIKSQNNKTQTQMCIYYLMLLKSGARETVGFADHLWQEYPQAVKKLTGKKEQSILKSARDIQKLWKKDRQGKKEEEEEEVE